MDLVVLPITGNLIKNLTTRLKIVSDYSVHVSEVQLGPTKYGFS